MPQKSSEKQLAYQKAYHKIYYPTHRSEILAQQKEYREAHPEKALSFYATHRDEKKQWDKDFYAAHRKERQASSKKYNETHCAEIKAQRSSYCKAHRADGNAWSGRRRALKKEAPVGDLVAIKEIYQQAREKKRIRCYLCDRLIPWGQRQVDHIIPISRGGKHAISNLAVACVFCNSSKHTKMPEEVGLLV